MLNPAVWTEIFHRASRETIGIALKVRNPQRSMYKLHKHRPRPGFEDYTICRTANIDEIFIVKPGVVLDDPEIMHEIFHGGPTNAQ